MHNVQDEMDGKLELRVMDDELVSTPDFLGYAQLGALQMPGQGWRNLDLVQDAGASGRDAFSRHLHGPRRRPSLALSVGRRRKINKVQSKVHLARHIDHKNEVDCDCQSDDRGCHRSEKE